MGWFNKKETTMIETSIGPISKETLKHNKELVGRMFDEKIKEARDIYTQLYEHVENQMEEVVLKTAGKRVDTRYNYYTNGHSCYYFDNFKHTKESKKQLNLLKKAIFKKKEFLENVETLKRLREERNRLISEEDDCLF